MRSLTQGKGRPSAVLTAFGVSVALALSGGLPASAAAVAVVPLATAANYAVLGASTVTNTGASTLDGSLGVSPGTAITGFPPGLVLAPGATDAGNAAADQAQADLTTGYVDAAGRSITATTTADLGNLDLAAGVYAGPSHSALALTGPLVLDGGGDPTSVFIFQTDSTLVTGSSSTVTLVNGAQACNVFWQVGSSATLGSSSVMVGNVMAQDSVTVDTGATVEGRALARTAAVTLDDATFTTPSCDLSVATTTTTAPASSTTAPATTTTTSVPASSTTTIPSTTVPGTTTVPVTTVSTPTSTTAPATTTTVVPSTTVPTLPSTTTVPATTIPTPPSTTAPATTVPASTTSVPTSTTTTAAVTTTVPTVGTTAPATTTPVSTTTAPILTVGPTTTLPGGSTTTTSPSTTTTVTSPSSTTIATSQVQATTTIPGIVTTTALARTGSPVGALTLIGLLTLALGTMLLAWSRTRTIARG